MLKTPQAQPAASRSRRLAPPLRDLTLGPPGSNLDSRPPRRSSHQGPAHSPGPLEETEGRHVVRGFKQHRFYIAFVKDAEAVQLHGAAPSGRRLDPRPGLSPSEQPQPAADRARRLLPPNLGSTSGSGRGLLPTLSGSSVEDRSTRVRVRASKRRDAPLPAGFGARRLGLRLRGSSLACVLFRAVAWTVTGGPRQCCAVTSLLVPHPGRIAGHTCPYALLLL